MSRQESGPLTLIFVRHGQSYSNLAQLADRKGDSSLYTEEFRNTPNSEFDLTPLGEEQAQITGQWIVENINGGVFDRYYMSSFKRAKRTAGHLRLPEAELKPVWEEKDYLREQDWGYFEGLPRQEIAQRFPDFEALREIDKFYRARLGGESQANLELRARIAITTAYREVPDGRGIIISHGNTIWAYRMILEGLTMEQYRALDNNDNPLEAINNCQVLEYSRINPFSSDTAEKISWMRSICPWDMSLSKNEWVEIEHPKFTNAQLLER